MASKTIKPSQRQINYMAGFMPTRMCVVQNSKGEAPLRLNVNSQTVNEVMDVLDPYYLKEFNLTTYQFSMLPPHQREAKETQELQLLKRIIEDVSGSGIAYNSQGNPSIVLDNKGHKSILSILDQSGYVDDAYRGTPTTTETGDLVL